MKSSTELFAGLRQGSGKAQRLKSAKFNAILKLKVRICLSVRFILQTEFQVSRLVDGHGLIRKKIVTASDLCR